MSEQRINPEVVLKAAQIAIPFDDPDEWNDDLHGHIFRVILEPPYHVIFNPLTSDADAMKLERALKKEGWRFYYLSASRSYAAINEELEVTQYCDSDTKLLLICVSAQFSIPLYLENT